MQKFLNTVGSRICDNLLEYSRKWQQPINVNKTVYQVFHAQVKNFELQVTMENVPLERVKTFKYLGFTWTDKLSLQPTVDKCLENIQKSFIKLRWINRNKNISTQILRTCFFAYAFPFFTWIFPFFPMLPATQKESIRRKFRAGLRLIHRCPYIKAADIYKYTREKPLDRYICEYLQKRLAKAHRTDLGHSMFYEDLFYVEQFDKHKVDKSGKPINLYVGHLLRQTRVKKMLDRHQSYLLTWLDFIEKHANSQPKYNN
jgi:hypothetical protein